MDWHGEFWAEDVEEEDDEDEEEEVQEEVDEEEEAGTDLCPFFPLALLVTESCLRSGVRAGD